MEPRPQLKLVLISLPNEYTKPLAPETPGFPLDAPSKKFVAKEELVHQELKSSPMSRIRQEGDLAGLMQTFFDNLIRVEPIQFEISDVNVEGDINFSANST